MRVRCLLPCLVPCLVLCPVSSLGVVAARADDSLRTVHGQPSWMLANADVDVAVTRLGGHMAPVTFDRGSAKPIRPYHVSPWQDERPADLPAAVLVPLRGDFFCMPFGGNAVPVRGESHPAHGEVASAAWRLVGRRREADGTEVLALEIETKVRPGKVTKELSLVPGHPVVYSRHRIEGFAGPAPLGHHATLALPAHERALAVSVSPFRIGMTNPGVFSDPANGEYQALAAGATFTDLAAVPGMFKDPPTIDCTRLPTRRGYADLLAVVADTGKLLGHPAWTAAVNTDKGWAWFSLRDPAVLPTTLFWIEDGGRHGVPWSGRNHCLGLEDVCTFFAGGLADAIQPNAFTEQGVRTAVELSDDRPTEIRYVQGAVRVPAGFDRVDRIEFEPGVIRLVATSGPVVTVPVRHEFVLGSSP